MVLHFHRFALMINLLMSAETGGLTSNRGYVTFALCLN